MTDSHGGSAKRKGHLDEARKEAVKSACERLRCTVRSVVEPKSQSRFLNVIDQIQQQVVKGEVDLDAIQGTVMTAKGHARRSMRDRPVDMVQLINGLDGIDLEISEFFRMLAAGGK